MIYSMTAFASQQQESEFGRLTVDLKSVNNRFLDLSIRLPEELRFAENALRELVSKRITRGKVELRLTLQKHTLHERASLDTEVLLAFNKQLEQARLIFPDMAAPTLHELISASQAAQIQAPEESSEHYLSLCLHVSNLAITHFIQMRAREGKRLADSMSSYAENIQTILMAVRSITPSIQKEYHEKLSRKLREVLEKASGNELRHISGEELSARIATESSLFALRTDVAEELDRLDSHIKELSSLLQQNDEENNPQEKNKQSLGKRLDFLFQEMNREINTLGSKSTAITITKAVIDLKLLVEQLREQAQNIE